MLYTGHYSQNSNLTLEANMPQLNDAIAALAQIKTANSIQKNIVSDAIYIVSDLQRSIKRKESILRHEEEQINRVLGKAHQHHMIDLIALISSLVNEASTNAVHTPTNSQVLAMEELNHSVNNRIPLPHEIQTYLYSIIDEVRGKHEEIGIFILHRLWDCRELDRQHGIKPVTPPAVPSETA